MRGLAVLLSRSRKTKIMGLGEWKEEDRWEPPWVKSVHGYEDTRDSVSYFSASNMSANMGDCG